MRAINTGVMCVVMVSDINRKDGMRFVDLGNYFEINGKRALVTTLELASKYGHLVDVEIYTKDSLLRAD